MLAWCGGSARGNPVATFWPDRRTATFQHRLAWLASANPAKSRRLPTRKTALLRPVQTAALHSSPREQTTRARLLVLQFVPCRNLNPAETGFPFRARLPVFNSPLQDDALKLGRLTLAHICRRLRKVDTAAQNSQGASMPIFRRLRAGLKPWPCRGQHRLFDFAFFTHAVTPSVLLAGPTPGRELGARSKTAPAAPPFPFCHCHGFSFRCVC